MRCEVESLEQKGVFERVPRLPQGRKAIPLMWVYDHKTGPLGEMLNEKARVVILGNRQGVLDFGDTYSVVARSNSIRIVFAYACYALCYYSRVFRYSLVAAYGLAQISTGVFRYEVF